MEFWFSIRKNFRLDFQNGMYVFIIFDEILLYVFSVQFEVLSSPTNSKWTTELTDIYDKYLEDWVGDYWLQPKYLPEGFKVLKPSVRPKPLFCFLPILKLKSKLADTFGRYRNRNQNHILKGKFSSRHTMEDSFTLKCDPQIILGFFDPDPVLFAKQGRRSKGLKSWARSAGSRSKPKMI